MVLPCLMSVFNSIGGSCLGWIGEGIKTETTLLFSYAGNVENLRKQVENLSDAIKSVEVRIKDAESQGKTIVDAVVVRLLERMDCLKEQASKIITDEERSSDSTCLMGLRPNLWACYLISKSARKAIDEAAELLEKEKTLDRVVANVDFSESLGVKPILEFEEFESRVQVSNEIMAALKDPSVNMVGVYGMGGAGKTTLAEKIGADLHRSSTFSYVVLATVSEKQNQHEDNFKPDLLSIQKQIAEGFKIQLQGETLRSRATELDKQLRKRDRVLIILDDIWSKFEPKDVGIPIGNVGKKFKILMTSRSETVLRKEMNSTKNFGLDSLPHRDALTLFDRMVGVDSEHSKWLPTAEQVVKQCGGIPIILVTIARALRNEDFESWEDALNQLKQFDGENIVEAYRMIEVSYKFLNNEEKKKLLLLCAQLNHRSISKNDLLRYAMGLNLFNRCTKVKEVRNRLHRYLSDLKGCCLLQDGNEQGMIKMHDVVHKFASFVAIRDYSVFTVANDGVLEEWPSKEQFEKFIAVSLPYCHLPPDQMLPYGFDNPKLESFLMFRNEIDGSFQIPDNFFEGMKGLKLMDLTGVSLSSVLLSSFEVLVKLQTLCLDRCELNDIAVIGELPMLQALSLSGSSIITVPKEIQKLGKTLKLLDLRRCEKLQRIAAGVIFRLTLLEELLIGGSYQHWEHLEGNHKSIDETNETEVASLEEFKNLKNLINLELYVRDQAKMFPKDLVFTKLETFKIVFGSWAESSSYCISTRTLWVNEWPSAPAIEFDSEGSKALMTSAENLLLEGVTSCVNVSEMDPKGFPELKHLKLEDGMMGIDGIRYIVKKNYNAGVFPKLETLDLFRLEHLESICDDHDYPLLAGSFENLRVIEVRKCELLNHLLSSNLARGLSHLKEMRVENCESMESIILSREGETEHEEEIKLGLFTQQLLLLKLCKLPRLMSFCSFKKIVDDKKNKRKKGVSSPTTPLFNKKITFPKLEVLELTKMKIEKIWEDHLAITTEGTCWLQNLTSLEVSYCHNLSYVFTSSMVKSLTQLKDVVIKEGESIEEIVKGEMKGEEWLIFPKLESLELSKLPKLKRFCHANLLECPSLQMLKIWVCPVLKAFINTNESSLFDEKILFPKLEKLELYYMEIEKIWDFDQVAITAKETTCWFQNLTSLEVFSCDNLRYLFTYSMVKSFAQLKRLKVQGCKSMEEIVASSTERDIQLSFPKLDNIMLEYLPNLERFCQGTFLECPVLRELLIEKCSKLKTFMSAYDSSSSDNSTSLFTEKVAFPNIQELIIRDCDSLEKVFVVQRKPMKERETCIILPFQNLETVVVANCQSLTSIFSTSLILNCQQLKRLDVRNCVKIDWFGFDDTQQLSDAFIKVISSLKSCFLDVGGNLTLKFEDQQSKLKIVDCGLQLPSILFALLKCFPRLDKFEVSSNSIIQLFPCEPDHLAAAVDDDMDTLAKTLAHVRRLKLTELSNMKHIWSEHSALKYRVIPSTPLFTNLTGLKVNACGNLSYLFTTSIVTNLAKLKQLEVSNCESIEEIVASPTERATTRDIQLLFPKLDNIELKDLPNLKRFCQANLLECQLLRKLVIQKCSQLVTFMSANDSTPDKVAFPKMEKLCITDCDSLEKVFDIQVLPMNECRILRFQNLQSMDVLRCPSLTSIFPTSFVPTSQQLELLRVEDCDKFDLFGFKQTQQLNDAFAEVISSSKYCNLEIGGLKLNYRNQNVTLKIDGCGFQVPGILFALLKSFSKLDEVVVSSNSTIMQLFPCESDHPTIADGDDIDTQAETLGRIGCLTLYGLSNVKQIWSEHSPLKYHGITEALEVRYCESLLSLAPPSTTLFKNLTSLDVWTCPMLRRLVASSSTAKSLVNLKTLTVAECYSLEDIVGIDGQCEELSSNDEDIVFENLEVLRLQNLCSLTSFCSTSDCKFQFPSLNRVIVTNCLKMKFFCKGSLSTPELIRVSIDKDERKRRWEGDLNSTIRQLFKEQVISDGEVTLKEENQNVTLEIVGCGILVPSILFARLESFPKLDKVVVSWNSIIAQLFPNEPDHMVATDEDDMNTQAKTLGRIGCLTLYWLSNMKQIWSEHSPLKYHGIIEVLEVRCCGDLLSLAPPTPTLFKNLTGLKVDGCHKLSYLLTSSMVKSLAGLKQIKVSFCDSIEEIVAWTETEKTGDIQLSFPNLEKIELDSLPSLKRFCEANLLECQSLQELVIDDCSELKTFVNVNDSSTSDSSTTLFSEKLAFPNMEKLKIVHCESLTNICPTSLVPTTFQQLKRLEVRNCGKIDLFGFNNTQQFNDALAEVISNLKDFRLKTGDLELTYVQQRFKLEIVGSGFQLSPLLFAPIVGCDFQVPPVLIAVLKSFPKLDKVEVFSNFAITQLFPCESDHVAATTDGDDMDNQAKTLGRIGCLSLYSLPNMEQIWSEHSPLTYDVIPEVLEVESCGDLLSLAPPTPTLFKNLTSLSMRTCHKLRRLVASSSTAKSLVSLKKLTVSTCYSLEEIVGIDDQRDGVASNTECIVFEKLEFLQLQHLGSLTGFCSIFDCNFRFPSLDRVIVDNCRKMTFFCKGNLSTPKLIRVELEEEEEKKEIRARWEGDLNATIRQMFEESEKEEEDDDDDGDQHGDESDDEEVWEGETEEEDE